MITSRRRFIGGSALAAGASLAASRLGAEEDSRRPFVLGFAPHPDMFKNHAGPDVLDQIRFAADQGFTAWEDNGLMRESPQRQTSIGKLLADRKMQMGVFVAYACFDRPVFTVKKPEHAEEVLASVREAVDVAKRVGATWMTVVPGSLDQQHKDAAPWKSYGGPRLDMGLQTANVIDLLRRCAEIVEPHGLVLVLEALNTKTNHGGVFLNRADQSYALCKAVNSPGCKMLHDLYHMQIEEGNLIPTLDHCWDEIAYLQSGDNPGRNEPGTGEINYANVFRHIRGKGYRGVIGMEHGSATPGRQGEADLIAAYRAVDPA